MKQNIAEFEYLALIVNYNEFLDKTILKKEYFEGKNRIMFEILVAEYSKNKSLVISELVKYKNFDSVYFVELLNGNVYNTSKELKFKLFEKQIIENFKDREIKKIIGLYSGDSEKFFKEIENIKKLNVEENEYIIAEDVAKTLEEECSQVKLGFGDLDKSLYISENDFVILAGGTGTGDDPGGTGGHHVWGNPLCVLLSLCGQCQPYQQSDPGLSGHQRHHSEPRRGLLLQQDCG